MKEKLKTMTFKQYTTKIENLCLKHIMNSPLTEGLHSEICEAIELAFNWVGLTLTRNQILNKAKFYFEKASYLLSFQNKKTITD